MVCLVGMAFAMGAAAQTKPVTVIRHAPESS